MRGLSRSSLAAAQERLEPALSAAGSESLGAELFSVVGVLDAQSGLRRALTDPSRDGGAKASLVARLLGGQISPLALDVVSGVVRERWSTERDLSDALEQLGTQALLASAERDRSLERVEDEVFRLSRIVSADPRLTDALGDWRAAPDARAGLVHRLLDRQAHPVTLALVLQAVAAPRGRRLDATLADVLELAAARRQRLVAVATAAVPLSSAQQERLGAVLQRVYGRQVLLEVDIDPAVVGGLRIAIGDEVLDATVLSRLADARRRLAGQAG